MAERYDDILILGYVEGDLSPADRERFERMLAQDARLRLLVDSLLRDRNELRSLPSEPAPPEVLDRVNLRIERNMLLEPTTEQPRLPDSKRRLRLTRILAYSGIAAMVLVAAGLILQTFLYTLNVHTPGSAPAPGSAPGNLAAGSPTAGSSSAALALKPSPSGPDIPAPGGAAPSKLAGTGGDGSGSVAALAHADTKTPHESLGKVAQIDHVKPGAQTFARHDPADLEINAPARNKDTPAKVAANIARGAAPAYPEAPAGPLPRPHGKVGPSINAKGAMPADNPAGTLRVQVVSANVAQTNQALIAWAENNRVVALAEGEVVVPVQRQTERAATVLTQDKQRRETTALSNTYDQPGQQAQAAALAQAEQKLDTAGGAAQQVGGNPRTLTLMVQPEQVAGLLEYLNNDKDIAQAADIVAAPQAQEWSRLAQEAQRPVNAPTTAPAADPTGRAQVQARELRQLAETGNPSVKDRTAGDWQNLVRTHLTRDRDNTRLQQQQVRPPLPLTLAVPVEIVDLREAMIQGQQAAPNAAGMEQMDRQTTPVQAK